MTRPVVESTLTTATSWDRQVNVSESCCRPPHVDSATDAVNAWLTAMVVSAGTRWTPSSRYTASPRAFPERLPPLEYPGHFLVKRVTNAGTFRLKHKLLFIANALKQHHIGLDETDDGIWSIYFGTVLLAKVDEREMIIRD